MRSEWTKLTALRSTRWSLFAMAALTVLFTVLITSSTSTGGCAPGGDQCEDVLQLALGGVYLGQIAAATLGVLAISSESTTGMIRTTFAATPRRQNVVLAKAAVVAGLVLVIGLATSVVAYLAGAALEHANGFTPEHGYGALAAPTIVRGVVGTAVYFAVLALFSLGIGAILRSTAAAISTVLALLWVPLILISLIPMDLGLKIARFCPMFAGLAIQRSTIRTDTVPIAPGAGLALFAAYAALALGFGVWLVRRRDA